VLLLVLSPAYASGALAAAGRDRGRVLALLGLAAANPDG
jgi:hypothetical protein